MKHNFELFRKKTVKTGNLYVTISKNGHIRFGSAVVRKYKIKPGPCNLYWDAEDKLIGIEPSRMGCMDIKSISDTVMVYAKSFLAWSGCLHTETTKYPIAWDNNLGMLVIDLADPISKLVPAEAADESVAEIRLDPDILRLATKAHRWATSESGRQTIKECVRMVDKISGDGPAAARARNGYGRPTLRVG